MVLKIKYSSWKQVEEITAWQQNSVFHQEYKEQRILRYKLNMIILYGEIENEIQKWINKDDKFHKI